MKELVTFFKDHLLAISLINVGVFVGFMLAIFIIFSKLPHDYWITRKKKSTSHGSGLKILRNILAAPVFLMGCLMLLLPGQGVLTILLSLMLADFEKKERWLELIIQRKKVRKGLDYIRKKMKSRPFSWPAD